MKGAVTGTHGFVGSHLVERLTARGDEVIRLVRGPAGPGEARWDPARGSVDAARLEGLDYVVHLAGANIGARLWTRAQRRRIRDSRVQGTRVLAEAIAGLRVPPRVFLSASAVGYYGDRGEEILTEDSGSGTGFRADVCRDWEEATEPAEKVGVRVCHLRSAIILSTRGGLLPFLRLRRVALRLGSGRQWWSWISIDDEIDAIVHLLDAADVSGPVNLTAPDPVRQRAFASTLAATVNGRVVPVPGTVMEATLGPARAREVFLSSQRVLPARLLASGYRFRHQDLRGALAGMFARHHPG